MPKLHRFASSKSCYFCGAHDVTKEHVPPRMITEGMGCGRFTVPACPEHNGEKSGRDRAVVTAIVRGLDLSIQRGFKTDASEVLRAYVEQFRRKYSQANGMVTMSRMLADPPSGFDDPLPYIEGEVRILDWFTMLSAGLLWVVTGTHENGVNWGEAWTWSPDYFRTRQTTTEGMVNRIREKLYFQDVVENRHDWRPGWQPTPPYPSELYRFDASVESETYGEVAMFRHHVFGQRYFTVFGVPPETAATINEYLNHSGSSSDDREISGDDNRPHPPALGG